MRVSAAVPVDKASKDLAARIKSLGLQPIVTNQVVRAVYEGSNKALGEKLINLFEHEPDHDIYCDNRY